MPKSRRAVIHGFYGMGNLGDEAILQSLLHMLQGTGEYRVVVLCQGPNQVKRDYHVKAVHSGGGVGNKLRIMFHLVRCDLFLLGGGGLIKDYGEDSSCLRRWLTPLRLAQLFRKKTAIFCIGAENIVYQQSKLAVRKALRSVTHLSTRDENSRKLLRCLCPERNARVGADPALLHPAHIRFSWNPPPADVVRIAVCVRHWYSRGNYVHVPEQYETFKNEFARGLDLIADHNRAELSFLPMRNSPNDNDHSVATEIRAKMKPSTSCSLLNRLDSTDAFAAELASHHIVIGMRLHSLILAAGLGIPMVGLAYMPKVRDFMESIDQSNAVLSMELFNAESLADLIDRRIANLSLFAARIRSAVELSRQKFLGVSKSLLAEQE